MPDALEQILDKTLCKDVGVRFSSEAEFAAALSRIQDDLDNSEPKLGRHEKFKLVKGLSFFDEFTDSEIREVLNAAIWQDYQPGDEIIHEGEVDNSFFVIVQGTVAVRKGDTNVDRLQRGEYFGETGFIRGKERSSGIIAADQVSTIKFRSLLVERTSKDCQLRFHKIFPNKIVSRLSRTDVRIHREQHAKQAS